MTKFILIPALLVLIYFLYKYLFSQKRHIEIQNVAFSKATGLLPETQNPSFLRGVYRGFEARVGEVQEGEYRWKKIALLMQNPNAKALHIAKPIQNRLEGIFPSDSLAEVGSVPLKATFPAPIQASTNDLLFASFFLKEETIPAITGLFNGLSSGLLAFQGNELFLLSPILGTEEDAALQWKNQLDLLWELKNGLQ